MINIQFCAVRRAYKTCISGKRDLVNKRQVSLQKAHHAVGYDGLHTKQPNSDVNNRGKILLNMQLFNKQHCSDVYSQQAFIPLILSCLHSRIKRLGEEFLKPCLYMYGERSVLPPGGGGWAVNASTFITRIMLRHERRVSNDACRKSAGPSSLVVPPEYFCHFASEYLNGHTRLPNKPNK